MGKELFGSQDVANVNALVQVLNAFNIAGMKLEILTVAHETKNVKCLVENAISELAAQKIRLHLLFDLCMAYKNFVGKSAFVLSNNTATKMLFDVLPENFKRSAVARIALWLKSFVPLTGEYTNLSGLSGIKSFLSEDFYTSHIIESLEYADLISDYNAAVLGNKPLNYESFVVRVDLLINKLFEINDSNKNIDAIVELLVAKLMLIKEQVLMFDKNLADVAQNTAKLELLTKFKVLLFENKNFKTLRSNKAFTGTFDLFVSIVKSYFATKTADQASLAKLLELKQLLLNMKQENQPGRFMRFLGKKASELVVLDEMLSILEGVIKEITGANTKTGGILTDGMNMLEQLKTAGFDGSMIAELAGAFFNKRFKSTQDAALFIAAKTGPVWMKKIVPFLPDDLRPTVSALLNTLVDVKSAMGAIDEAVSGNVESVVATSLDKDIV